MATTSRFETMTQQTIRSLFDLTGKVVLVTGGAGWLGTAITETVHELGATVVIASRSRDKADELIGRLNADEQNRAHYELLDITREDSVGPCFQQVVARHGRIDVLVNNSYAGTVSSLLETSLQTWQANLTNGLSGPFLCLKECIPHMKATGGGSIINIASMYGMVSPDQRIYEGTPFQSSPAYGAAKAAIIQLTRYAACELAPDNIRVNAISPGPFPAPETQKNTRFMEALSNKNPMHRIGQPWELKGAVAFLATNASSFVTGQNIAVDGGWTIW